MAEAVIAILTTALVCVSLYAWALWRERERERVERERATERLLMARKDGYEIPPAVEPVVELPEALIPELQALVDDWEGEGAKAMERKIRTMMAEGKSQAEVARILRAD